MKSSQLKQGKIERIATSKNGVGVYCDMIGSRAATHLDDTPGLRELVVEITGKIELTGQRIGQHFDMQRVVGTSDVVMRREDDEIVYCIRRNRHDDGLVPFTKSRTDGDPTSLVAIQLIPQEDGVYILTSC